MNWIKNLTGGYSSQAKVVDGTLILSLPDALSPIVWRMDMKQVKSTALEVQEQKDGTFLLAMKTPKGESSEIAPFDERHKALKALMAISHALENAHGQIHTAAATSSAGAENAANYNAAPPAAASRKSSNLVASIIGIGILLVMIYALVVAGPRTSGSLDQLSSAAGSNTSAAPARSGTTGAPVSADDFLRNRSQR